MWILTQIEVYYKDGVSITVVRNREVLIDTGVINGESVSIIRVKFDYVFYVYVEFLQGLAWW